MGWDTAYSRCLGTTENTAKKITQDIAAAQEDPWESRQTAEGTGDHEVLKKVNGKYL